MQEFYAILKQLWVLWLMLLFVGIVAWAYWPKRKSELEEHGKIPFKDQDGGR